MKKKELPASRDTERAVLGCMLSNKDNLLVCIDVLERDDFFFDENKIIFDGIKKTWQSGKPADLHIVANTLKSEGMLDVIGGIPTLASLCQSSSMSHYAEEYCCLLKDKHMLRTIINKSTQIAEKAFKNPADCSIFLDDIQKDFCSITFGTQKELGLMVGDIIQGKHLETAKPYLNALLQRIKTRRENPNVSVITGIPTGFKDLDNLILGLNDGNLVILSACTSVGKTALALNIAEYVACKQKIPVGIFSLEMTTDQLVQRMICSYSNLSTQALVSGDITDLQLENVKSALSIIEEAPITVDDKGTPKIHELRSKARRLKACRGIKLLIIDYLTLIEPSNSRSTDNRQVDVANISRSLKLLARELGIPILCLAQLSRKVDDRPNKRPVVGDLRDSGAIEHDADVIIFLYRKDYYDKSDHPGEAELIVAKNRHGPIGSVYLRYNKETCRFTNATHFAFP
jgi:replicative DNA helicase